MYNFECICLQELIGFTVLFNSAVLIRWLILNNLGSRELRLAACPASCEARSSRRIRSSLPSLVGPFARRCSLLRAGFHNSERIFFYYYWIFCWIFHWIFLFCDRFSICESKKNETGFCSIREVCEHHPGGRPTPLERACREHDFERTFQFRDSKGFFLIEIFHF